jgi:hypothetical protein
MPDGYSRLRKFRTKKQMEWFGFYRQNRWARRFMLVDMDIRKVCEEFKRRG